MHAQQLGQNQCRINLSGGRNQENLVLIRSAVYAADHNATQGHASLLEGVKACGVAYDESIPGGGGAGPQPGQEQEEQERFEPHGLPPFLGFLENGPFRISMSPAASRAGNPSFILWTAPLGSGNSSDSQWFSLTPISSRRSGPGSKLN